MHQAAAIEIRGLTKRYKTGTLANDHIDLNVAEGTVMGVLGPNGAGKTTMIRQVTGELTPSEGSIRVHGVDVLKHPLEAKYHMGVVPQEANVYSMLKAREQLVAFGRLHGMSRGDAETRADELMEDLGLVSHKDKLARELSGGLKRKVLLGTALMARPAVLILDEPTTGLDPHARRDVWAQIRALRRHGTSVLITTHYMDEAEALSDVVSVIGDGKLLAQGTIEELRARCTNRYKAIYYEGGETLTVFGRTQAEVLDAVESRKLSEFSVMRTSLEDLYLELTGSELEAATVA